jgi:hypothetical protein
MKPYPNSAAALLVGAVVIVGRTQADAADTASDRRSFDVPPLRVTPVGPTDYDELPHAS